MSCHYEFIVQIDSHLYHSHIFDLQVIEDRFIRSIIRE
jgi:hypothetical protein